MRKLVVAIAAFAALSSCNSSGGGSGDTTINGTIEGIENGKFIVSKLENRKPLSIDTIDITNGKFTYSENIDEADFRLFVLMSDQKNGLFLYFGEDEQITLKGSIDSLDKAEVTGSDSYDLYKKLIEDFKSVLAERQVIMQEAQMASMQNDTVKVESLKESFDKNEADAKDVVYNFAKENNDAPISPWALNTLIQDLKYDIIKPIFDGFTPEVQKGKQGILLLERLEKNKK